MIRQFLILCRINFAAALTVIIVDLRMLVAMVQYSSVAQSCLTLCDPVDCNMAGFLVHHQLLELAQTHVHQVTDSIQPSHPQASPSPPAFNLAQPQGLFQ